MNLVRLTDPEGTVYMVPEDRLLPYHTISIHPMGYQMRHPITCVLLNCDFETVAEGWFDPPAPYGVYQWNDADQDPATWAEVVVE